MIELKEINCKPALNNEVITNLDWEYTPVITYWGPSVGVGDLQDPHYFWRRFFTSHDF